MLIYAVIVYSDVTQGGLSQPLSSITLPVGEGAGKYAVSSRGRFISQRMGLNDCKCRIKEC